MIRNTANGVWCSDTVTGHKSPEFSTVDNQLTIAGNGEMYTFGFWEQSLDVTGGTYYRFRVEFAPEDIEDCNICVLNALYWIEEDLDCKCSCDNISSYKTVDGKIVGEDIFRAPKDAKKVSVQLSLRYAKKGKVTWSHCALVECSKPKKREARVSVVKWHPYECSVKKKYLSELREILDECGQKQSDIVLLPEFTNRYDTVTPFNQIAESIIDGETITAVKEMANKYNMYVCADFLESDNGLVFNTAVLFNRKGEFVGKYRKTHLYWPESRYWSEVPGDEYPIFDLDFGRVGIMICYDNWYPEVSRLLGLKGAELLLFPNEGYDPIIMPARAVDSRVYIAVSSLEMPSSIYDVKGNIVADCDSRVATAIIDLAYRPALYPIAGGTMNHSSGGRRGAQNTVSTKLYSEILAQVTKFSNNSESFLTLGADTKDLSIR